MSEFKVAWVPDSDTRLTSEFEATREITDPTMAEMAESKDTATVSTSSQAVLDNDAEANSTTPDGDDLADNPVKRADTVVLPRWVVYLQGALLGVIATTFFIFGMMVGSLTGTSPIADNVVSCQVSGTVLFRDGDESKPDSGAVVILLPKSKTPDQRAPGELVSPEGFQPLDNPGIDLVHQLGGAVVRADDRGRYEVIVDSPGKYDVLIVSKSKRRGDSTKVTKDQMAAIGSFYFPVDAVLANRAYYWGEFTARPKPLELPQVEFK